MWVIILSGVMGEKLVPALSLMLRKVKESLKDVKESFTSERLS